MNGEKRGFDVSQSKGILDRRQKKVSPDSFDVTRDKLTRKIAGAFLASGDDEPVYDNISGRGADQHREKFEQIKKVVEKEWLPEFKEEFIEKIDLLRQSGNLNLTPEEIKKRLASVQIYFFSKGSTKGRDIDAKAVTSPYSSVLIEVDTNLKDAELRADLQHTFNHEMLHVVSGSLFLTTPKHLGIFNTEKYRRGLVFGPLAKGEKVERFRWLNEAVTESLALEMNKDKDRDSAPYRPERLLLSLLVNGPAGSDKHKVDRKKFSHAYFENYEPKDEADARLKNWKELVRSINKAYYPGFLVKIDKLIEKKGLGYVINHFHILCENEST